DIFSMSINDLDNEHSRNLQLKTIDYLPISFSKIYTVNSFFDLNQLPAALFPTIRNHHDWYKLNGFNFNRNIFFRKFDDFYKGFMSLNQTFDNEEWKKFLKQYEDRSNAGTIKNLNDNEK